MARVSMPINLKAGLALTAVSTTVVGRVLSKDGACASWAVLLLANSTSSSIGGILVHLPAFPRVENEQKIK